jgi:hypothetical protein
MFRLTLLPSSGLTQTSNEHGLLHLGVGDTYCPRLLLQSWLKVVVKVFYLQLLTKILLTDVDNKCLLHQSAVIRVCLRFA